jgi:hypothetical protein
MIGNVLEGLWNEIANQVFFYFCLDFILFSVKDKWRRLCANAKKSPAAIAKAIAEGSYPFKVMNFSIVPIVPPPAPPVVAPQRKQRSSNPTPKRFTPEEDAKLLKIVRRITETKEDGKYLFCVCLFVIYVMIQFHAFKSCLLFVSFLGRKFGLK